MQITFETQQSRVLSFFAQEVPKGASNIKTKQNKKEESIDKVEGIQIGTQ